MRLISTLYLLFISQLFALGKNDSLETVKRHTTTSFITESIVIDGHLDEAIWATASPQSNFIQYAPNPGSPSKQKTDVVVLYDNNNIYIGAWLYEVSKDSVTRTLSERDQNENADIFNVSFDTYNDDQNAFSFSVTAAGVQLDSRISLSNSEDKQWNAVWYSAVEVNDQGWFVEMKIPFSALRFSEKSEQTWGINFSRTIRRIREESHWNYRNPLVDGQVNQFGDLKGIKNIKSPLRLFLTPYVSAYYDRYDDKSGNIHEGKFTFNGGMDLKYGLSEAFTLDMTLIPDFGQVQSDNRVLNTSPFEVRFNEFRQFFTEGTEIYNKTGLFYSRRIGGTPINYSKPYNELQTGEDVIENPESSKLINASKITGRTRSGTGIGFFNALTKETYATIQDSNGVTRKVLTDPLTNYNVFVVDQNLKNNSYVNFTNTNVWRNGGTYDANVTAISSQLNTKQNKYGIDLSGRVSQQYGIYKPDSVLLGHTFNVGFTKKFGNFNYGAGYYEESDTYDPNDLGFLYNNNSRVVNAYWSYRTFTPKKHLLRTWYEGSANYERLYFPNAFTNLNIYSEYGFVLKSWTAAGIWGTLTPLGSVDYFEPRVVGRYYSRPYSGSISGFISTDYRKKFAFDIRPEYVKYDFKNWYEYTLFISPRYRFNDKISTIISCSYNYNNGEQGSALDLSGSPTIINDTIIFASRNRTTIENIASLKYSFTNKMALSFRLRHYWAKLFYTKFYNLNTNGSLSPNEYTGLDASNNSNHNTSLNIFNIDLVYTWVFAPGSELRFVWKNSIFNFDQKTNLSYYNDFTQTLEAPQNNSFSIKLIYFIDALMFKKKH